MKQEQPVLFKERTAMLCENGAASWVTERVVIEQPLTVYLNGTEISTMICSPHALKEAAAGYLISEGLLTERSDLLDIQLDADQGRICFTSRRLSDDVLHTRHQRSADQESAAPSLYFAKDARQLQPIVSDVRFDVSLLLSLVQDLEARSDTFHQTGGVHTVALANPSGMLYRYEDIGRHNALDKVVGHAFLNDVAMQDKCVVLSGRIASEMLIKSARAGIPVVLSRSAPMQLSLEIAEQLGMTVIGFARGSKLTVYTGFDRVIV